jgi:hypothetical protein
MAREDDRPPTPLGSIHIRPRDLKWTRTRGTTDGARRTPLGQAHGIAEVDPDATPRTPASTPAAVGGPSARPDAAPQPGARRWPWLVALALASALVVVLLVR